MVTGALMIAGAYYHGEAAYRVLLGVVATFLWFAAHRRARSRIGVTPMNSAH
jgi:hypothetical protein